MRLCFASNNAHKLDEIRPLLPAHVELLSLADIGCEEELPETQDTLEGNALQKAHYVWGNYGVPCFADDTGLEVNALDGAPGVYSARYAGPQRSSADNVQKLLRELPADADRTARFRTVIALVVGPSEDDEFTFSGEVMGRITAKERGAAGFGYDPIFEPEDLERTFAEMSGEEKNQLSHRARAVAQLTSFLKERYSVE
ncbi:RdgB/HAM1 family non-canonical purine NTP pyrophosphatase [Hymenobacter sp. CRA2]|uniref:RdgB/HAM1 family non-canonical purine NTP pyrophosphatase n=1 Tax=Hymenobacter sp. CRA2 TaxID=1955620 RepID=UPI00098FCA50|nr:RdgB/HAM1 family non-canonical purine NTP pyrophosphatase [Hymenobacter sp. CRA2]OON67926.1 non-canonical purine NTP pyrophosphatase, RdgB/HAM1 family [Hymenobacter sp. CRA2]